MILIKPPAGVAVLYAGWNLSLIPTAEISKTVREIQHHWLGQADLCKTSNLFFVATKE